MEIKKVDHHMLAGTWWQNFEPGHVFEDAEGNDYVMIERELGIDERYNDRREDAVKQALAFLVDRNPIHATVVLSHHVPVSTIEYYLIRVKRS